MTKLTRRVKMSDVASAAGVSTMTVSRALRSDASISEETRKRILALIESMGYVPDSLAGALASQRSGFVAVMLRSISNPNLSETVHALDESLERSGLQLLIGNAGDAPEKEEALVETMLRRRPEAFVLSGGNHTLRTRRLLETAGIPIVEAFELPSDPINHVVGFSNAMAIRELVRHLHGVGHRNIAYIGGTSDETAKGTERRRGYLEGVKELGLGRGTIVSLGGPPAHASQGCEALARLVSQYPEVDAAICVSDLVALAAIMECHRRGWSVPGRISIAGFGNSEVSAVCEPGITTVAIDVQDMGRQIGRVLLDALEAVRQSGSIVSTTQMVDFRIIERGSTQPLVMVSGTGRRGGPAPR